VDSLGGGDTSLGLGVVGLAGNLKELMRDAFAPFSTNCWAGQPLESPACMPAADAGFRAARGGSWFEPAASVFAAHRDKVSDDPIIVTGFRCVRPGS
jgi:formylglycine-generating enzyme required for sulfatase activity